MTSISLASIQMTFGGIRCKLKHPHGEKYVMNAIKSAFSLLNATGLALVMCTVTYWVGVGPIRELLFEGNTPSGTHVLALSIMVVMCAASLLDVWKQFRNLWK
jgi:hypothetical protein